MVFSAPPATTMPTSLSLADLRELTRFRAEVIHDRTVLLNRLHAAVDLVFPELLQVLPDLGGHTAQVLLSTYPTAAAIAAADAEALGDLLHRASRGHFHRERVSVLVVAARASIALRRSEAALATKVSSLVRQVAALTEEIADLDLDKAIASEFDRQGYRTEAFLPWLRSWPKLETFVASQPPNSSWRTLAGVRLITRAVHQRELFRDCHVRATAMSDA